MSNDTCSIRNDVIGLQCLKSVVTFYVIDVHIMLTCLSLGPGWSRGIALLIVCGTFI